MSVLVLPGHEDVGVGRLVAASHREGSGAASLPNTVISPASATAAAASFTERAGRVI